MQYNAILDSLFKHSLKLIAFLKIINVLKPIEVICKHSCVSFNSAIDYAL